MFPRHGNNMNSEYDESSSEEEADDDEEDADDDEEDADDDEEDADDDDEEEETASEQSEEEEEDDKEQDDDSASNDTSNDYAETSEAEWNRFNPPPDRCTLCDAVDAVDALSIADFDGTWVKSTEVCMLCFSSLLDFLRHLPESMSPVRDKTPVRDSDIQMVQ